MLQKARKFLRDGKKRCEDFLAVHKRCRRIILCIFNHIPFNNKFDLRGNKIHIEDTYLRNCTFKIRGGGDNIVKFAEGSRFENCRFFIYGNNNQIIGGLNTRANDVTFWIEEDKGNIIIGDGTSIGPRGHLACIEGRTINIGKDCMFSSEVHLCTGDSHSIINSHGERINASKDVIIGNHVWVGYRVTITKGATIQEHSIVGTGSVVTRKFNESHIILAGVPANIIKQEISWKGERI